MTARVAFGYVEFKPTVVLTKKENPAAMQKFAQRSQNSHLASNAAIPGPAGRSRQELGNALRVPVKTTTLGQQPARAKDGGFSVPNFDKPAQFSNYSEAPGYQRDVFDTDYAESDTTVSEIEARNFQRHPGDIHITPYSGEGQGDDKMDGVGHENGRQQGDQEPSTPDEYGFGEGDGSDSEDSAVDENDPVLKDIDGVMGEIEADLNRSKVSRFDVNTRRFNSPWATKSYPTTTDGELPEEANQFPTTAGVQHIEENVQLPRKHPTIQQDSGVAVDQYALRQKAGLQHREELAKAYHLRQEAQLQQQISQPVVLQKQAAVLPGAPELHTREPPRGSRSTPPVNKPVAFHHNPKLEQINGPHDSKSINQQDDLGFNVVSGLTYGTHRLKVTSPDQGSGLNAANARSGEIISHEPVNTEYLDYDLQSLMAMDYQLLKDEPLDKSPEEKQSVPSDTKSPALLPERLSDMAKLSSGEQALFFASLSIDEWEESGHWFTEQFAILKDKVRHSRQERRRIAQGLESEVAARYTAVSREQQSTEHALRQMKENGRLVVQRSTPKRKRG